MTPHTTPTSGGLEHRRRVAAAGALGALVVGALFFSALGAYPLLDPDEARHAEVAREMATGRGLARFVLPTLDLEPYREKPPGFYWLVTLAFGLGGVSETSARAVSATAALATVLAAFVWSTPRAGAAGALGARASAASPSRATPTWT
jgi:4-amino-4-deoxy-L-arabinose transferase-like glycosyltransferase